MREKWNLVAGFIHSIVNLHLWQVFHRHLLLRFPQQSTKEIEQHH